VKEVEDAIAEAAESYFCEVIVPDYFALGFQSIWGRRVECWIGQVPDGVFEDVELEAEFSVRKISTWSCRVRGQRTVLI